MAQFIFISVSKLQIWYFTHPSFANLQSLSRMAPVSATLQYYVREGITTKILKIFYPLDLNICNFGSDIIENYMLNVYMYTGSLGKRGKKQSPCLTQK